MAAALSRFIAASRRQKHLLDDLRAEFQAALAYFHGTEPPTYDEWHANQLRLRSLILKRDLRVFLTWDVIANTMFVPLAQYTSTGLSCLQRRSDWGRWRSAVRERRAGFPFPCPYYPLSSANAIHHAYHLVVLEEYTGAPVHTLGTICEFGGGYGSMCRVVRSLGFSGQYFIFDLPEFSALQRYYLVTVGAVAITCSEVSSLAAALGRSAGPRLFFATWSLSESPAELRQRILAAVSNFDAFLFAYQDRFSEQDNRAFFSDLPAMMPADIRWRSHPIAYLPGNSYLMGTRTQQPAIQL